MKNTVSTFLSMKQNGERLTEITSYDYTTAKLVEKTEALEAAEAGAGKEECPFKEARYYHDVVFTAMQDARAVADELETVVGAKYWPFPTYGELLFNI